MNKCIFCQIAQKQSHSHLILEDDLHIAFLSIFPNTDGFTVVATKEHLPSYVFDNSDETIKKIILFAKKVAKKIDLAFNDVGRTGLIMEGFGVNHLHIKLFPMHGTKGEWRQHNSKISKFFVNYEGYISSHDYDKADHNYLERIASLIKNT